MAERRLSFWFRPLPKPAAPRDRVEVCNRIWTRCSRAFCNTMAASLLARAPTFAIALLPPAYHDVHNGPAAVRLLFAQAARELLVRVCPGVPHYLSPIQRSRRCRAA